MSFFISNAMANTGGAVGQNNLLSIVPMLVIFGLVFFFLILRPQQKRAKAHSQLMSSISKGDEVMTNGGLIGRVSKVSEAGYLTLELNANTEVIIKRDFITAVLPKGTMKSL